MDDMFTREAEAGNGNELRMQFQSDLSTMAFIAQYGTVATSSLESPGTSRALSDVCILRTLIVMCHDPLWPLALRQKTKSLAEARRQS